MGASAVSSLPGGGVVSAATGALTGGGGLGDIASSALGAVGGGVNWKAVTKGAGIVGAATNVLSKQVVLLLVLFYQILVDKLLVMLFKTLVLW